MPLTYNPPQLGSSGLSSSDLSNTSDVAKGDALIGYSRTEAGAIARTLHNRLLSPDEWVVGSDFLVNNSSIDQSGALQNALDAAADKGLVLPPWDIRIDSTVNVPDDSRILAYGTRIFNTVTHLTLLSLGSRIHIQGLELEGAGNSTYNASGKLVSCVGASSAAYKTDIWLEHVYLHNASSHGFYLQFAKRVLVSRPRVEHCGYAAIMGLSVSNMVVTDPLVDDVSPGTSGNTYGISFTRASGTDLGVSPRSENCYVIGGHISNVPLWTALDTHGGSGCRFVNVKTTNTGHGATLVPSHVSGIEDFAPQGCHVLGCIFDNAGQAAANIGYAVAVVGSNPSGADTGREDIAAEYAEGCVVALNTADSYGPQTTTGGGNSGYGAYTARNTKNLIGIGNTGKNSSPHTWSLLHTNYGFNLSGNASLDPHSNSFWGSPAHIAITAAYNTGYIGGNTGRRENAALDTNVAAYGLFINSFTGISIALGPNYFEALTGDMFGVDDRTVDFGFGFDKRGQKDDVRARSTGSLGTAGTNFTVSADFKTLTSTTNAVLPSVWDTVTPIAGDTVLYANGTTENGKYVVVSVGVVGVSPWILRRSKDADTSAKLAPRHWMFVREGLTYTGQIFQHTGTTNPILGTTSISYQLFTIPYALISQLRSTGTAPTAAAGSGAGTSSTVASMTGSADLAGKIDITTGTSPSASATLITITYARAYGAKPKVILTPANAAAAALSGTNEVYVDDAASSTSAMVLKTGTVALAASTQYVWYWHAIQ